MICEKCGMQNLPGTELCSSCGASMPPLSGCGGFGDILSFENTSIPVSPEGVSGVNGGYSEADMKNLLRKTDNVIKQNDRNGLISVIAVAVSAIVLICSIVFGVLTMSAISDMRTEISALKKQSIDSQTDVKLDQNVVTESQAADESSEPLDAEQEKQKEEKKEKEAEKNPSKEEKADKDKDENNIIDRLLR